MTAQSWKTMTAKSFAEAIKADFAKVGYNVAGRFIAQLCVPMPTSAVEIADAWNFVRAVNKHLAGTGIAMDECCAGFSWEKFRS